MLSRRECELSADAVTVLCSGCGDEYMCMVPWILPGLVIERDRLCDCPLDLSAELATIDRHYNPPPVPESHWAAQYQDGNGGLLP